MHPTAARIAISQKSEAAPSGADDALKLMSTMLVGGEVSQQTGNVIRKQLAADQEAQARPDPAQTLGTMTALILGSPEFQMR